MKLPNVLKQPLLKKSLTFARNAHENQKRYSGENYIIHPLEVAKILSSLHYHDKEIIAAGLLHDVIEKTNISLDHIEHEFGENIKNLVDGVSKLSKIYRKADMKLKRTGAIKKLFVAMSSDSRVILIKLADRLHNMRTLHYMPKDKKILIATETLEIYSPVANLLGLREWAWELEDLSFKFLYPKEYEKISNTFKNVLTNISGCVGQIKKTLCKVTNNRIKFKIQSFKKNNYHIYRMQKRKNYEFDPIKDTSAIKIITNTVDNCYKLLGLIHNLYPPKPASIKDYIAMPKINGYQGLHTTIFGPEEKMLHIQIRTEKMDKQGIIFHKHKISKEKFLKNILSIHRRTRNPEDFVNQMKLDILGDKIFVLSSKGKIIDLPENSTCIDFAYAIRINLGHFLKETIVNGTKVHPCTKLKTGDIVKIITDKNETGPNIEWLEIVQTNHARHHILNWHKRAGKDANIKRGKAKLDKILRKILGTTFKRNKKEIKNIIKEKNTHRNLEELLEKIGNGIEKPQEALSKIYSEEYLIYSRAQKGLSAKILEKLDAKPVKLIVKTINTVGILNKLTQSISSRNINIDESTIRTFKETKSAILEFVITVKSFEQLYELMTNLEQIPGIRDVYKV